MRIKDKIIITLYYLKNSLNKIKSILILMTVSISTLFIIHFSSSTFITNISNNNNSEYLLIPVYNDGEEYLEDTNIIDNTTIKKINEKFHGSAEVSKLSNEKLESIYIYSRNETKEVSICIDEEHVIDDNIASVNKNIAKNLNLSNGDTIRIGGMNLSVYAFHDDFDCEANLILSKRYLKSLVVDIKESNQLKLMINSKKNVKIYLESVLDLINEEKKVSNIKYNATQIDLSEILIVFIKLITNFLFGLSIFLFLVSLISISNVINISVLERKQEFIIFKTFGLRNSEISSLLIFEIVTIALSSLAISLVISFSIVKIICVLLNCYFSFSFIFLLSIPILLILTILFFSHLSVKNTKSININDI